MHANHQPWQRSQLAPDVTKDRRETSRCEVKLKVVVQFSLSPLSNTAIGSRTGDSEMVGETLNLSETGLAVCLPSNRIGNRFLSVAGCKLRLTLTLPTGTVQIHASPRWCEKLTASSSGCYVIGLRVTRMDDEQWVTLARYVRNCLK